MERDSRKAAEEEGFAWGPDTIEDEIRGRIRGMIESIVDEELEAGLGAGRSQRVGARTGYRHGARERQLTTSLGKTTIKLQRARLKEADGAESEWHSRIVPRYQRRTERVDTALLGAYLSGINSRRLRARCRRCCVERLYRRMRYHGWLDGCAMNSRRRQPAIWPRKRSAICSWMVGIRACELAKSGCACRTGRPWGVRGRSPHRAGDADCRPGKRGCLARIVASTGRAAPGYTDPGGNRRQSRTACRSAGAMAGDCDPALHQPQRAW
jgi:hypothetical protein